MAGVWVAPVIVIVLGYLLGSIPFGLLLTRSAGLGDIRTIGSGNIGATNVLRTGNKALAAATLLLDAAKGAAAVFAGEWLAPGLGIVAGGAAFVGHCYPVWLKFKGGKGIATYGGVALALMWPVGLIFLGVWVAVLAISRYSSLGGIVASIAAPVAAALWDQFEAAALFIALGLIVIWKHRDNIERLMAGTEPRVGQKTPERD